MIRIPSASAGSAEPGGDARIHFKGRRASMNDFCIRGPVARAPGSDNDIRIRVAAVHAARRRRMMIVPPAAVSRSSTIIRPVSKGPLILRTQRLVKRQLESHSKGPLGANPAIGIQSRAAQP